MGRPRKNPAPSQDEGTPRYQNLAKLAAEERERKANPPGIVSRSGEMVISYSNRRKYREVIRLENGNVYRRIISKDKYDELIAQV